MIDKRLYYSSRKDLLVYKRDIFISEQIKDSYRNIIEEFYNKIRKELNRNNLKLKLTQIKIKNGIFKVQVIISFPIYTLEIEEFKMIELIEVLKNMDDIYMKTKRHFG